MPPSRTRVAIRCGDLTRQFVRLLMTAFCLLVTAYGAAAQQATTTAVTANPNPSVFGQTVTLQATVSSASGTPTGTVHFTGPNLNAMVTLSNGVATTTSTNLTSGTVIAEYTGSGSHQSSSGNAGITVNRSPTTTSVSASPNPSRPGDTVIVTATVTAQVPESGPPTGTVGFTLPGGFYQSAEISGGVARIFLVSPDPGEIHAEYFGDIKHGPSDGSVGITVDPNATRPTTTRVVVFPDPSNAGEPATILANVSHDQGDVPSGTLTFEGPGFRQTAPISGGNADITVNAVESGPVTATFEGTSEFQGSSETVTMTVIGATTTTEVTASPNPSNVGDPVLLTATVTSSSGGVPTGTVTFSEPGVGNQTVPLVGGQATVTSTALVTGTVTATYNGSTRHTGSSDTVDVTVNAVNTTTTVAVDPDPSVIGQTVTFTATVAPAAGETVPDGTITFSGPGGFSQSAALDANGTASVTTSAVASGTVTAAYGGNDRFLASQGSSGMTVGPASTVTAVVADPNPATAGGTVILTATVTAQPPGSGTPNGTVTLTGPGGLNQTATLNAGGVATVSMTAAAGTITASYAGNAAFAASQGTVELEVDKIATATVVTAVPNPVDYSGLVTYTATVTTVPAGQGTPAGSVLFTLPGGGAQVVTLDANGIATLQEPGLQGGVVIARYLGNATFAASQGSVNLTVNPIATQTAVVADPNPSTVGETVTLTATVTADSPAGGVPAGTVRFVGPRGFNQVAALDGAGTASVTLSAAASGVVTAIYQGNQVHAGSQGTVDLAVDQIPTTTAVTVDPADSVVGQPVTLTATVAANPPGGVTPSGIVTFTGPGGLSVNAALNASGVATVTTAAIASGTVTASYAGNATFAGSQGTATMTVDIAPTATAVTAVPDPSDFGQTVTLTATVTATPPGTGVPSGTVTFRGPRGLNLVAPLNNGQASVTTSRLGSGTVTATYSGSAIHAASSGTVEVTVTPPAGTFTMVTATPNPSFPGQPVTLTATVAMIPPGTGTPTGTVTFTGPGGLSQTAPLDGSGSASIVSTTLQTGTVVARYSGSGTHAASSAAVDVTVDQVDTTTAVTIDPNPSVPGETVTVRATVTPASSGAGTPTGTIAFSGPGGFSQTVAVDGSGVATATLTAAASGTITATYNGDAVFVGSTGTAELTVNQVATQTTVVAAPNPSVSGETVTVTATVTPAATGSGTPTGTIAFSGPGGFSQTAAVDANGAATVTLVAAASGAITATYSGDAVFIGSAGTVNLTVNLIETETSVVATPNPSNSGETVTLTATVSALAGSQVPAGTVTFSGPGGLNQTVSLNASGTATVRSNTLQSGTVTATYAGTATFGGSSGQVAVTVQALGRITIRQVVEGVDAVFDFSSPTAALNLSISTINGQGESPVIELPAGAYAITAADMTAAGYALTALACSDDDSTGNVANRTASINLAAGEEVVCVFTSVNSREKTTEMIEDFFETRANLILANQPDIQRRIDRLNGQASSATSVTALLSYLPELEEGNPVTFSASLASMRRLPDGSFENSPFDLWFAGTYVKFDTDDGPGGDFGMGTFGADYLVTPDLLIGGFIQVDRLSQSASSDEGSISGTGWIAGPYATTRISQNVYFDIVAGMGTSSNKISPFGTYEDGFDATRWLVSASLQGEWEYGAWTFSPRARASYFEETSKQYVDSLGVTIPDVKVGLGQIAFGPGVSYRHETDGGVIVDTGVRVDAIADFIDKSDDSGFDNLHARVEGAIDFTFPAGARLGFSLAQDGIGSGEYQATSGRLRLSVPLN